MKAEANTYHLPRGEPIRRKLVKHFRAQRKWALSQIASWTSQKDLQGDVPASFPPFPPQLGTLDLAEQMTPLVQVYWDESGKRLNSRLGIDPDKWEVTNPHTADMIRKASLSFSASTNATTSKSLNKALGQLREELIAGVVTTGESVAKLTKRVESVFDGAEKWRARRIAQTEASRAVHAAQDEAGRQSGVVAGWEWLLSSDACPMCQTVARRCRYVRMGQPFAEDGDNPAYRDIRHPPLHPHCNCTMLEVLTTEAAETPWGQTLVDPKPEDQDKPGYEPPEGGEPPPPKPLPLPSTPFPETTPAEPKPAPVPEQAPLPEPPAAESVESRIEAAVQFVAAQKIPVLPTGTDIITKICGVDEAKRIPAAFIHNEQAAFIAFNPSHPYWADPKGWMAKQRAIGWLSTDAENHPVLHESGHALHLRAVGRKQYRTIGKEKMTPAEKDLVTKEVSRYAATNPHELVAEVYAGMVSGQTYSPKVMGLYNFFQGPSLEPEKPATPKPPKKPKPAPVPKPAPPPPAAPAAPPSTFQPAKPGGYHPFGDPQEADAWGERYRAMLLGLPPEQQVALARYASSDFTWMNGMLRGQPVELPKGLKKKDAEKLLKAAAAGASAGTTDRPIVAYRGIANLLNMGYKSIDDLTPGLVLKEQGFGSTSVDKEKAAAFANFENAFHKAVFEIRMPTGSTGVYLNAGDLAKHREEREFLVPPDAEYRVVGRGGKVTNRRGEEVDVVILERVK